MRILALFLSALLLLLSCQKEPDVTLKPIPDPLADTLTISYFSPDSVIVGMNIRIGGTGFDTIPANNIVKVNDIQLTLISVNDSVIIATIPESATTGKISITVNGKTVSSLTNLVVSQKPPATPESNGWVKKADYTGDVADEGPEYYNSFSLNGKGYYLKQSQLWEYSQETNSWTQKAPPPSVKINGYGFCFTILDKVYVGLGGQGEILEYKQVWEYNATTNTWTQKKDFPGSQRVIPFSFSIGTNGYIGGGDTLNAGIREDQVFDFWKYESTTDTWTRLSDFPGTRALSLSGVSIGNEGFVVELGANNPTAPLTHYEDISVWKYDPGNDSWQKKAKLPTGGLSYDGGGTTFVINDKIYLGAGVYDSTEVNGQTVRKNFWMFDPIANSWTNKKDIGGGLRLFGHGFAINGKGYIGLGTGATADKVKVDFWEYNP